MSNYKAKEKAKAKYLYFNTNKTQKAIAELVGVSEQSLSAWVRTNKWAEQKMATYYSPDQELNQLYEELGKITDGINARIGADSIPTKEELEKRKAITALIAIHTKNANNNWRNIAAEYDVHNPNIIDLSALSAMEKRNLEKRQAAAEEDERLGPGKRFSADEMDDYYTKVAKMSFAADSCASKVGKDGKPLAEDDPQRLKWEEMMRQGKRPFRRRRENEEDAGEEPKNAEDEGRNDDDKSRGEDEKRSGGRRSEDGRSNDDLPDGWTWMDMPEEEDE